MNTFRKHWYQYPTGVTTCKFCSLSGPPLTLDLDLPAPKIGDLFEFRTAKTRSKRKSRKWHFFQHFRSAWDNAAVLDQTFPVVSSIGGSNNADFFVKTRMGLYSKEWTYSAGELPNPDIGLEAWYAGPITEPDNPELFEVTEPDGTDDLVVSSLKYLHPKLQKKVSLVNSVIELKDLITLKHTISRIAKLIFSFKNGIGKQTLRAILGSAADGYLQAQFNILPLISDIKAVITALSATRERLKRDLDASGSPVTSRYRKVLLPKPTFVDETEPLDEYRGLWNDTNLIWPSFAAFQDTFRITRSVVNVSSVFHAQLQYIAKYTKVQRENALLFSRLDDLGVNLNPAIIWNAIPWSFVVDWIVNVQSLLDKFAIGFMDPEVQILQYSYSIRRERNIRLTISVNHNDGQSGWAEYRFPTVNQVAYRRVVDMPKPSLVELSGLSLKEFSLATALVLSRQPKHHTDKRRARGLTRRKSLPADLFKKIRRVRPSR